MVYFISVLRGGIYTLKKHVRPQVDYFVILRRESSRAAAFHPTELVHRSLKRVRPQFPWSGIYF